MNWELLAKMCHEMLHGNIYEDMGICGNIRNIAYAARYNTVGLDALFWEAFSAWPEFSGDVNYPVPHIDGANAAYWHNWDLWSGEYGAARMRLLNFVYSYACAKASNFPMRDVGPFKALLTGV